MKETEVTFKFRVRNSRQLKDVVVLMTSAANQFFENNDLRGDIKSSTVIDYKCHDGEEPHPLNMSNKGKYFLKRLKYAP